MRASNFQIDAEIFASQRSHVLAGSARAFVSAAGFCRRRLLVAGDAVTGERTN
jgi:hypothetical protein